MNWFERDKLAIMNAYRAAQATFRVRTRCSEAVVIGWEGVERASLGIEAEVTLLCGCGCGHPDGEPPWTLGAINEDR